MQWARADMASLRNTRPGHTTRMGSGCVSMVRTCTDEVWVRRSSGFKCPVLTKKVSCISRAGWLGGKFRASNTW